MVVVVVVVVVAGRQWLVQALAVALWGVEAMQQAWAGAVRAI